MHDKGVKKNHTRERKWSWDRRESGEVIWSEREVFGKVRRWVLSREIKEKWEKCRADPIEISISRWIKSCWKLSRIKKARNSYREAIEWCPQQTGLDGSRSYRASIEKKDAFSTNWEAVEELSRQISENSIDWVCVNFCWERKSKGLDK